MTCNVEDLSGLLSTHLHDAGKEVPCGIKHPNGQFQIVKSSLFFFWYWSQVSTSCCPEVKGLNVPKAKFIRACSTNHAIRHQRYPHIRNDHHKLAQAHKFKVTTPTNTLHK